MKRHLSSIRLDLVLLLLLAALIAACGGPPAEETTAAVPEGADESVADGEAVSHLFPTFHPDGPTGAVPERLRIEFSETIFSYGQSGEPLSETVLEFTPPVEGTVRFEDPKTLVFEPSVGFVPGQRYEIELSAVESKDGVIEAPAEEAWQGELETPDFQFVRLALVELREGDQARVELVFSGAVDPGQIRRRARFEVVGEGGAASRITTARFTGGSTSNVAHVLVPNRPLTAGSRLRLILDSGVAGRAGGEAPAASAEIHFGNEPLVEIADVYRGESANGFYVQVVCDDQAAGQRLGFWDPDRQRYWELSRRCLPDDDAAREDIAFDPPVDFNLAPARGGFRLFGDFDRGSYKLTVDNGLRTVDGGALPARYETTIEIPRRSPQVRFVSKGRYLPKSAAQLLPVRHLNLEQARLTVRHVPPENLVFWMSDDGSERADERDSNLIHQGTVPLLGLDDELVTSYLDLASYVPRDVQGLLEVELAGGGVRDVQRILLTDLHLVAKRFLDGSLTAWALDVDELEPRRGVEIRLVRKSGQALATCQTGRDGGCRLAPPSETLDPSPPFALIARQDGPRGQDLTYLKFADLELEVQEERVAGEPYRGGRKYRAALYSERGVYRPGESAHLAAIVRGEDHLAPPPGMPVQAAVVDPRGKILRQLNLTTNEAGFASFDLDFADFAPTGRWEVRLEAAGLRIGEHDFQVEEFVPERMKVEALAEAEQYRLGEAARMAVAARYLFGGVPADHKVEMRCDLEPGNFEPEENAAFHYGVWRAGRGPQRGVELGVASGQLDADGRTVLTCPGQSKGFAGPARLVARAAVFESGSGRTTVGRAEVPIHPADFYVGLSSGTEKVEAGEEFTVDGVTVDWQGEIIDRVPRLEIELVRVVREYGWYFDEVSGRWTNRETRRPVTEERREVEVMDGKFRLAFTPSSRADAFLVRARGTDAAGGTARTDLELQGSGTYYWWQPEESGRDRTPEPGRATWLALTGDRAARVGKKLQASFEAPFAGRLLLTAETDEIVWSEWREVREAGRIDFSFRPKELIPNVYLTAFLIKDPRSESPGAYLPERAFGVVSVPFEPEELTHDLALTAPEEVRSSSTLRVELDLGATDEPTFATVAAVDEGILSLTRFESPDPFPAIFERRALGVDTFETVGWTLLVPPGTPTSTEGGDAGAGLGRVQSIEPVALWSGLVEVPADGKLAVDFEVPQYRGALRVMAVTAGREKMGRADAQVLVRDPLVVDATLPRFLTRDDDIRLPVFVTNLSGEEREVRVEVRATAAPVPGFDAAGEAPAPVEIRGDAATSLTLADGAGEAAVFRLRATVAAGAAKLEVVVSSGDLRSVEEVVVPVLPAGPKTRRVARLELEEGRLDLRPHLAGWEPLSERSTFWVTSQPYGDVFGHLKHLVRYPYGCIEQTSSTTRPLLYLSHLLPSLDPELAAPGELEAMAQSGVDRLLSMQTAEGGFSYWPGAPQPIPWGTAYATQILLEAQKLQYRVPQDALDESLDWMERQITHYYEKGQTVDSWYWVNAEPYMHYVLALAGRARQARIERLIGELGPRPSSGEDKEHLYLLQAALYLAGDQRHETQLRSPDLSAVTSDRSQGWTFYSDRRRRGVMLSTMVDLFGRPPSAEPLASLVAEMLRGQPSGWYTTQELAWSVVGLGKYAEEGARDFAPPVLLANGRAVDPQPPAATSNERTWHLVRASEYESLELELAEKGEGKLFLILASEGVRSDAEAQVGGDGLVLTRRYRDAQGEPVDFESGRHQLGDLVYVELALSNTSPEKISNIALVDRIPAGWEIENPRLGRGTAPDWVDADGLWALDHMDLRDDRLEVFGHLERGKSGKVVYAVRAVTAGQFTIPAVEAEAMYDPRIWARQMGRKIFVNGPWVETGSAKGEGVAP